MKVFQNRTVRFLSLNPVESIRALAVWFLLVFGVSLSAQAQSLLFRSDFKPSTTLRIPQDKCFTTGCWQFIDSNDQSKGATWPPNFWGGTVAAIQLLADRAVDATTVRDYAFNQIINVTGRAGTSTHALYSQVTQSGCCGGDTQNVVSGATQNALQIQPVSEGGDLYISYWLKYQPDLDKQLNSPAPNWRYLFSWKTGTSGGINDGDFRIVISAVTWCVGGASICWETRGDNVAGSDPYVEFWREQNTTVAVPIGQWFKFEVFWHRSTGGDGRFWAAVNGQPIVDHFGPNKINKKINRIFVSNVYGSGPFPMYQWLDDLKIYDGFPLVCTDPPCAPH